jgi:hypothetical protein
MESRTTSFGEGDSEGTHRLGGVAPPPPQVSVRLISHRPLLGAFLVVAGDVSRAKQEPGE